MSVWGKKRSPSRKWDGQQATVVALDQAEHFHAGKVSSNIPRRARCRQGVDKRSRRARSRAPQQLQQLQPFRGHFGKQGARRLELEPEIHRQSGTSHHDRVRTEPAFEQPAGAAVRPVGVLHIPLSDVLHDRRHTRVPARGHQHIGVHGNAPLLGGRAPRTASGKNL